MVTYRKISFGVLIVACGLTVFFFRLQSDLRTMESEIVSELKSSHEIYNTLLRIEDDPYVYGYVTSVVATDLNLDRRVLVKVSGGKAALISSARVGDKFDVQGVLEDLSVFQRYRKHEHIVGEFIIDNIINYEYGGNFISGTAQVFRSRVIAGCSNLTQEKRGVCEGLLVGERNHISKEIYTRYRNAQMTHLLVASGANIAFLVGFISPLISRRSRIVQAWVYCAIAIFYCVVTRFEPSIVRACLMVIVPQILVVKGFKFSPPVVFLISSYACIILDPFLIFRVGFWLSLGATAGLRFISPYLYSHIGSQLIANTLAATIGVQPVLWAVFGFQVPSLWWLSAIGVAVAEPISTVGLILVILAGFGGYGNIVSSLILSPVDLGVAILNNLVGLEDDVWAHVIGVVGVVLLLIAYTISTSRVRSRTHSDGSQRFLHYR